MYKQNFCVQFSKTSKIELSCDEKWEKLRILFANFTAATCTIPVFLSVHSKFF